MAAFARLGVVLAVALTSVTARAAYVNACDIDFPSFNDAEVLRKQINQHRRAEGTVDAEALLWNKRLICAAQKHAEDVLHRVVAGDTSNMHVGSDGSNHNDRAVREGYAETTYPPMVGENAYYCVNCNASTTAYTNWVNSPGHDAQMLAAVHKHIGIGVAKARVGNLRYTVVIAMFGLNSAQQSDIERWTRGKEMLDILHNLGLAKKPLKVSHTRLCLAFTGLWNLIQKTCRPTDRTQQWYLKRGDRYTEVIDGVTGRCIVGHRGHAHLDICSSRTNQAWRAPDDIDSVYRPLRNRNNGYCLAVAGAGTDSGDYVDALRCQDVASQNWLWD